MMASRTTTSPIDCVLDALCYQGPRNGGNYKCHCPAHDDNRESLSVTVGENGMVLLKCHAGCDTSKVVTAMGLKMADLFAASSTRKPKKEPKRIVATYAYKDESGELLYEVVRSEPKGFSQRRPDEKNGWVWSIKGVRRVLYRLPELLETSIGEWVFVAEGEKDVEKLRDQGLAATSNAQGAGKWEGGFNEWLRDRLVCVLPDNDDTGRKHAHDVARQLLGIAKTVRVLELPNLPVKGDVSDWLEADGDADKLIKLVEQAPDYVAQPASDGNDTNDNASPQRNVKPKQADELYHLALKYARFFKGNQDGKLYASVTVNDHRECYRIDSDVFNEWLSHTYYQQHGTIVSAQARADAKNLLTYEARKSNEDVFLRVGHHMGKIYIDIGSAEWDAVEVDGEGWRLVPLPPVYFRRPGAMMPLTLPLECKDPLILAKHLNIEEADWPLLAAWMVKAMQTRGPYPVLAFLSRAGSGKSTQARILKRLVDPSASELRMMPKDTRSLFIAAENSWLLVFDNVSEISIEISDALCSIATGGGHTQRANYTDADEHVFTAQRPIIINGIGDVITRQDLMDRTINIGTPYIPQQERRDENEFWRDFNEEKPRIFGAFLYALSHGLANIHDVKLNDLPRMADFAKLATAAEPAYTDCEHDFASAYANNRDDAADIIVQNSPVGAVLLRMFEDTNEIRDTPLGLFLKLQTYATDYDRASSEWPNHHNQLKEIIERIAPALDRMGIGAECKKSGGTRRIRVWKR
jgi:hypothetical protein